jgi:CheY-like chemotaxis protein
MPHSSRYALSELDVSSIPVPIHFIYPQVGFMLTRPAVAGESGRTKSTATRETRGSEVQGGPVIRILVVDDDDQFRRALLNNLQEVPRLKIEARGTQDGESAIAISRNEPDSIDWILLDLTLPRMNGLETYHEIKKSNPHIRIILMTSAIHGTTARAAIKEGLRVFDKYRLTEDFERVLLGSSGESNP